jgi:hypothetical protein
LLARRAAPRPAVASLTRLQEAVEKYQQSKRELDEVVAQMESLVSGSDLAHYPTLSPFSASIFPRCLYLYAHRHRHQHRHRHRHLPGNSLGACSVSFRER